MAEQIGKSPAGVIEKVSTHIPPKKHIYWRPMLDKDGKIVDWVQTLPLPCETAQDKEQYLSRGFKLEDPRKSAEAPVVEPDKTDLTEQLYKEIATLREQNKELKSKKGLGGSSL